MSKEIPLTRGTVAIVDDEDYEWLNQWKWCDDGSGYAMRSIYCGGWPGKSIIKKVKMSRLIMNAQPGDVVDHINRARHDNRRCNLRLVNNSENGMNRTMQSNNTSGYKGVSWHKANKKWTTVIIRTMPSGEKKRVNLGSYDSPHVAAAVYNAACLELHGDFAVLNKIDIELLKTRARSNVRQLDEITV